MATYGLGVALWITESLMIKARYPHFNGIIDDDSDDLRFGMGTLRLVIAF